MVKTKIIETTEKYDQNGKLVEKIVREETTDDDTKYGYQYQPFTMPLINPISYGEHICTGGSITNKPLTSGIHFISSNCYEKQ